MAKHMVGDKVEVNINRLSHEAGSSVGFITDPNAPPTWAPAVVEGIQTFEGAEGFERYQIHITAGVLKDAIAEVGADTLRRQQRQSRPTDAGV